MKQIFLILGLLMGLGTPASADFSEVGQCWNTGGLVGEAIDVTVRIQVDETGEIMPQSIVLVGVNADIPILSGETLTTSVFQAFEAARRAIIRCAAFGRIDPAEPSNASSPQYVQLLFSMSESRVQGL